MKNRQGRQRLLLAFNLPCDHVIHTVGPIVQGKLTKEHERLLISCYESCLRIADENEVKSIAFCCISNLVYLCFQIKELLSLQYRQ
ncbi:MAG: macro domain-containing protein [Lachnospiraceae bacterium]